MIRQIWARYLFQEILKVFLLFLGCFFFLYSLIDYSLHMQDFIVDKRIQISHVLTYYTFQFIKRAELLIPLALLIAALKVLFSINAKGELVALQASGLALKKILRPFFFIALLCTLFNLISAEFLQPAALNYLDRFREEHFKHSHRGNRKEPIHVLPLKDRSKIVYQTEDKNAQRYIDVFWIRSADEMWRMQSLSSNPKDPEGRYVDHLKRNSLGNFEKVASYDTYKFSQFKWEPDPIGKGFIPLENRRASELFKLLKQKMHASAYEQPQILTHLLFKCTMPFLSFVVILAAAPFCTRHTRHLHVFPTYAFALFGFITYFAMMDAAVILGENLVLSPYIAIFLPISLCFLGFGYSYIKTR